MDIHSCTALDVSMEVPVIVEICNSDSSSISAASDPPPSDKGNMKEKVVEGEEIQPQLAAAAAPPPPPNEFIEYLKVPSFPNEHDVEQSSPAVPELETAGTSRKRSREADDDADASANEDGDAVGPKEFSCNFCNKKFSNSQALGGHQNAHKHLRAALKRGREALDMPWCPYPHMHMVPPLPPPPAAAAGGGVVPVNGYFNGTPFNHGMHSPFLYKPRPNRLQNHVYTVAGVRQGLHGMRMGDYYHAAANNPSGIHRPDGLGTTSRYNSETAGGVRFFGGYPASNSASSSTSSIAGNSIAQPNGNLYINGNPLLGGYGGMVTRWNQQKNLHNQGQDHEELDLSLKL